MSDREKVIVAAHGSRSGDANAIVNRQVKRLRDEYGLDAVAAFHVGRPGFEQVLDRSDAVRAVVVPFFSADGYYSCEELPRALARNRRFSEVQLRRTRAVGSAPQLPELIRQRALRVARWLGLQPERTSVLVVGHGTSRHPGSRLSTERVVARLRKNGAFRAVEPAFLDEPPGVEEQFSRLPSDRRLVIPFLIGGGEHVLEDLPRRIGLDRAVVAALQLDPTEPEQTPLRVGLLDGRRIVIDRPLGDDPALTAVIAQLAAAPASQVREGGRHGDAA